MVIKLIKNKLEEIIDVISHICSSKRDLNILNYFYLQAQNDEVHISATDLEINYQTKFPAVVLEEGKVLIPAKQFNQIIDNFYEDEITLETKGNLLLIKGQKSFASLSGLSEEDYPTFSEINYEKYFEIDNEVFEGFIRRLYPVLETSDIRPEYSGVYFDLKNNYLNLVATDTIRLSFQKVKPQFFETNIDQISVLIPQRIIEEYKRIKKKTGKVKIYFEESQITLEVVNHKLTSKISLVDYPNYQTFVSPLNFIFTFLVDREEAVKALKLTKVFINEFKEVELDFNFEESKLYIYAKNELLGETKNEIDIEIKENTLPDVNFKIKFHLDFLYDGFNALEGDKVLGGFFSGLSETTPLYLKSPIDEDFIYITIHQ